MTFTAVLLPQPKWENEAYVFCGCHYCAIYIAPNTLDGDSVVWGPSKIKDKWKSLVAAGFDGGVDAILQKPGDSTQFYFFHGDRYALIYSEPGEYDDTLIGEVHKIADKWRALKKAGFSKIDAVWPHPTIPDQAYFFSGDKYVCIKVKPGTSDDTIVYGPVKITEHWESFKEAGFNRVNAILPHPKEKNQAYVFSGNKYAHVEFDTRTNTDSIIFGPLPIRDQWPSLVQAGFV